MNDCFNCKININLGDKLSCPNCNTSFCIECAKKTKKICPNCYHDLEFSE